MFVYVTKSTLIFLTAIIAATSGDDLSSAISTAKLVPNLSRFAGTSGCARLFDPGFYGVSKTSGGHGGRTRNP